MSGPEGPKSSDLFRRKTSEETTGSSSSPPVELVTAADDFASDDSEDADQSSSVSESQGSSPPAQSSELRLAGWADQPSIATSRNVSDRNTVTDTGAMSFRRDPRWQHGRGLSDMTPPYAGQGTALSTWSGSSPLGLSLSPYFQTPSRPSSGPAPRLGGGGGPAGRSSVPFFQSPASILANPSHYTPQQLSQPQFAPSETPQPQQLRQIPQQHRQSFLSPGVQRHRNLAEISKLNPPLHFSPVQLRSPSQQESRMAVDDSQHTPTAVSKAATTTSARGRQRQSKRKGARRRTGRSRAPKSVPASQNMPVAHVGEFHLKSDELLSA